MAASRSVIVIPAKKHALNNQVEEKPKLRVAAYCRVSTIVKSRLPATKHRLNITPPTYKDPGWVLATFCG